MSVCISVYVSSESACLFQSECQFRESVFLFSLSVKSFEKKTRWQKFKMAESVSVEIGCMFATVYMMNMFASVCVSVQSKYMFALVCV